MWFVLTIHAVHYIHMMNQFSQAVVIELLKSVGSQKGGVSVDRNFYEKWCYEAIKLPFTLSKHTVTLLFKNL